jgi:ubiquinone/menaquinone biosynthesis C-methylase UbiE
MSINIDDVVNQFRGKVSHTKLNKYRNMKRKNQNQVVDGSKFNYFMANASHYDFTRLYSTIFKFLENYAKNKTIIENSKFIISLFDHSLIDDKTVYMEIAKYIGCGKDDNTGKDSGEDYRNKSHAVMYREHLSHINIGNLKQAFYLDIGCANGTKTIALAKELGIPIQNTFGADIKEWSKNYQEPKVLGKNFKEIQSDKLDFADGSFDLISAFMVLHHVKHLHNLLSEISRCLKKQRYLIIREHDNYDSLDHIITDVEHVLFEVSTCNETYEDFTSNYYGKYMDQYEWIYTLEKYGLKVITTGYDCNSVKFQVSSSRYFYAIFVKV